jgi:macrodomain Ter protein organizer (MatP/YcbG family)
MILNMHNKKTIILNSYDVVTNRKMISLKLDVWKKLISCCRHEELTMTKLINKMIDRHIQENDYDVEKIFNANLQVKKNVLDSLIDYNFDEVKQIEK